MNRFRAAKRLDALDAEIDALLAERRTLEIQSLGAEVTDAERRTRYFSIGDMALRRKVIGIERRLHELRQRDTAAAVDYWTMVSTETRAKLDDLRSDAPTSSWRRDIWMDAATLLWILGGAGWLAAGIPGAAGGAAVTAVGTWFIARNRRRARPFRIRQGEDALRSSEGELHAAQHEAAQATNAPSAFSASEAETGRPDGTG